MVEGKPAKPPQFSLWSLFKLTTWVAIIAAVFAWLPPAVQKDVVIMSGVMAMAFLIVIAECIVLGVACQLCRLAVRMAMWLVQSQLRARFKM